MASSRILSSKAVDKLQVNRLDAQAIRSDNIRSLFPSFLYSLNFAGEFNRTPDGGVLTINANEVKSIIKFTDRPFRQSEMITFYEFVRLFIGTFERDPPNGVLVHNEEQRSYVITLNDFTQDIANFNLKLLSGEFHNLSTVNGTMNLFVDETNRSSIASYLQRQGYPKRTLQELKSLTFRHEYQPGKHFVEGGYYIYRITYKDEIYYTFACSYHGTTWFVYATRENFGEYTQFVYNGGDKFIVDKSGTTSSYNTISNFSISSNKTFA